MSSKKDERKDDAREANLEQQPSFTSQQPRQEEIRKAMIDAFEEAKDSTQRALQEARKEIPRYMEAVNKYQEHILGATEEMAENYVDSQKEIINSIQQSAWTSRLRDNNNETRWPNWISSKWITEAYTKMISTYVDNAMADLRLSNNMLSINLDVYRSSLRQIKDNANVFSRIAVDNAKTFEYTMKLFNELKLRGSTEKEIHKPQ
jgi:coenzyme F420-reducing hydrogenase alpha subunit